MAVTFHGFSIRDYTSKMRSVDVFKCWPFAAGDVSREEVESWLPPMTVPKSRWWSDELAALRSNRDGGGGEQEAENRPDKVCRSDDESETEKSDKSPAGVGAAEVEEEKLEMVCPVCRDFNAATLTAVNAHIDGCLAQTMREERRQMRRSKSKLKAPKKRSIAEIFELEEDEEQPKPPPQQPQIETVLKFWPFGEDADEVSITVTKFRWLSRRLEALRSNGESAKSNEGNSNSAEEEEKLEMICPVCRVFNAATVTAVNAHIDGCLAQAMREERWRIRKPCLNSRPKAPKKRSITEILTVAPQINSAGDGELLKEVEEEDKDEINGAELEKSGCSGATIKNKKSANKNVTKEKKMKKVMKKKSKLGKRGVLPLKNESKKMKKKKKNLKMKKTKKNLFDNEFTAKKEDACKCKVQDPVNSSRKLKGTVGNKTVEFEDVDAASAHEKKLGIKISSEEKNEKVKFSDSVGKQQKAFSPIHGILKKHKHISGSTSSGCNTQDDTEESHCNVQVPSSDKHVRFSAMDYVIGPKKKNSFDETVFKLSSDVLASSFGKEQSSRSDEGIASLEASRNDDNIAINIDKRKEVCPIVESKQFSNALEQVAAHNVLKPCTNKEKSKHFGEKSESLSKVEFCDNNFHRFDRGNMNTLHFSPYADISRPLSAFQAGQITGINTKVSESEAFSSAGKVIDHLEDPNSQFAAVNTNANIRTYLEPSSSCSASYNKGNERLDFPLHTCGDNEGQALGGRMWSDMFSADMMDKSFLLPGWGKGSVRNNCMEHNFFGLPLNSHGELINFSSNGKVGMNQLDTSCTSRSSVSGLPVNNVLHQSSQEFLSFSERHVVHKTLQDQVYPFPHYPASLGVTELHGRERADIYQHNSDRCSNNYVQPLDSELNLMRNPFIEQNKWDKIPNHKEYGTIPPKEISGLISSSSSQPTMRLMGKDVPIGRSSKEEQQFVGGDTWAEEESRRRHYSEDATKDNSLLGRCSKQDWISGSPLQTSTENLLQSEKFQSNQALQSTLLMKGPDSEFLNLRSNHVSQNGSLGVSRNARSNLHHITQSPTSCAIYNRAPDDLPEQLKVGAKPQGLSFQSQVLPTRCNFSQPTSSNVELHDRKRHHHVTNSALEIPLLHSVVEEQAKISSLKRSYRSLPPWLLGLTHERLPGTSWSNSFPQNTWGHNFTTLPVNHLYPPNSVTSHCPRNALLCPASIIQPPHVSVTPVTKPPSAIDSDCRNIIKVTDKVKDDRTTKDYHPCTNSRKRPAANLVDLTKPNKLPNIEVQENLSRMTGLARETSSANFQGNTRAVELDLRVGARSKCCQNNEAQSLSPRINLGFDSFDRDGMVISGPVKLSPGAKHILKPSQNMDQDNSRPIHSVIPIAATTDCGRDLELQRKLTKVYRF